MRPAPFAAFLALLTVFAAGAREGLAADPETLRWRLAPTEGLLYKVTGPDAERVNHFGTTFQTVYGSDLRDGHACTFAVSRVSDLLWVYAFSLPRDPVQSGGEWKVLDQFQDAQNGATLQVDGKAKVTKKGSACQIEWRLNVASDQPSVCETGTIAITALFHQKKGLLASADFALEWSFKERVGAAGGTQPKKDAVKGAIALERPIDLGTARFKVEVDKAVERAVDKVLRPYLKQAPYRRNPWQALGHCAVVVYACLKAGVDPEKDPVLREAFQDVLKLPREETYSVALALMCLEAKSIKRQRPEEGSTRPRFVKDDPAKQDLQAIEALARWLVAARFDGRGAWTYRPSGQPGEGGQVLPQGFSGDRSNSQFAILALHAAARSGVKIPEEVFREIALEHVGSQEGDGPAVDLDLVFEKGGPRGGGWSRGPGGGAGGGAGDGPGTAPRGRPERGGPAESATRARGFGYGMNMGPGRSGVYESMSAAGVSSLLIARQWLARANGGEVPADLAPRVDRALGDGFAWLQHRFSVRQNTPAHGWYFYNLYSIEKATEIGAVARLGGHDWWLEGASEILLREKPNGGWAESAASKDGTAYETALAVLFLTRATAEPEIEVRDVVRPLTGSAKAGDEDAVLIEGLGLVSVRQVLAALDVRDQDVRKQRLDLAEKALAGLEEERRAGVVADLGKTLESPYPDVRRFGERSLKDICDEPIADAAAAAAWQGRFDEIARAGKSEDHAQTGMLRLKLTTDRSRSMRRAAALALSRLRAVEAIPDLIGELEHPDRGYRAYIHLVLVGTAGKDVGFDAGGTDKARAAQVEAWRAWWDGAKADLLKAEEERRKKNGRQTP